MERADHQEPSDQARRIVSGAYDLHVHVDPDVIARRITDIELAQRYRALGLAGFVLKSHYVPTAERAALVRSVVPGVNALGAVVLNRAVGGLNPLAVEIAAREGARVVWMPTVDAANEAAEHAQHPPGAKLPLWARLQQDLRDQGIDIPPVAVVDANGAPLPALWRVLQVIARHDMVLATGHLGRDEIMAVVDAAIAAGVRSIIVTHPDYPTQNLAIGDQIDLARRGVFLERCLAPAHSGKVSWERMWAAIRASGPERSILSTDLGQPGNPPVEDGLAIFADRLLEAGFGEAAIHTMAVANSIALATGGRAGSEGGI